MIATIVLDLTLGTGAGLVIILIFLAWIANNPSNAERIAYWVSSTARWVSKRAEDNAVKTDVTHRINDFAVRLQSELYGYTPPGLELKIVHDPESPQAFVEAGKLVVRLRPRVGRDMNFLTVASLFVAHTTFPMVKVRLRDNQRRGLDLTLTQNIVERERPDLTPTFVREWVNPAISRDPSLENLIEQLDRVDKGGFFLPVLCQELHFLEERRLGAASSERLRKDVQAFVAYLHAIARRRVGDEIPMQHLGPFIRIRIQIVSQRAKREASGGDPGPWLRFAVDAARTLQLDRVYFLGDSGDENRRLIAAVAGGFCRKVDWLLLSQRTYRREIFPTKGESREVESFMAVCDRGGRETAGSRPMSIRRRLRPVDGPSANRGAGRVQSSRPARNPSDGG
jgi:hypothetical protein